MRPGTTQCENEAYRCLFLLNRERFDGLYTRDTRRYEVVQIICGENGAHGAPRIGGGGVASLLLRSDPERNSNAISTVRNAVLCK